MQSRKPTYVLKHNMTPVLTKVKKPVNSSTCCSCVSKTSGYKYLHPPISSVRKGSVNAVKVSKFSPHHSSFDCKNMPPDDQLTNEPSDFKVDMQNDLKSKISAYTSPQLSPVLQKRRHGPAKVKQSVYCPSKAMREQYLIDVHPFNAEQIMSGTVRAKPKTEPTSKYSSNIKASDRKWEDFSYATMMSAVTSTGKVLDEDTKLETVKVVIESCKTTGMDNNINNNMKKGGSMKFLVNVNRVPQSTNPSTFLHTSSNNLKATPGAKSMTDSPTTALKHYATYDGKKFSLSLSTFSTKEFEE